MNGESAKDNIAQFLDQYDQQKDIGTNLYSNPTDSIPVTDSLGQGTNQKANLLMIGALLDYIHKPGLHIHILDKNLNTT